ncbi:MAG: N-acetyltransferase family protein [Phycisphaerae bacterium]
MEYIPVVMIRDNLRDIPQSPLPHGYSLRFWRPGDAETWVRIWQESETLLREKEPSLKAHGVTRETFDKNFGDDLAAMTKRCLFVVAPDGRDVGTTTAWYDRNYAGKPWGRIHWVAISHDHQGKGLAKPMMTAAMNLMKRLGHRRAILGTQTPRLAAIKVYLDFGFVPDMTAEDAARAWKLIQDELHHPALRGF